MKTIFKPTISLTILLAFMGHWAIAQKKSVALLPIIYNESAHISNFEKAALSGALRSSLASIDKYELLTRTDFSSILEEYDFQSTGFVDDQQRSEIGGMHGADYICISKLTKENTCYYIESSLVDVVSGHIVSCASIFKQVNVSSSIDIWDQIMRDLVTDLMRYDTRQIGENASLVDVVNGETIPVQLVEKKPSFFGCDANVFSQWVNERLVYPETANKNGIQGRVTLQFTIEVDGSVTNVNVLRGVDPALDAEAVRVISESPKWSPGKQRDRAVRVTYTFPVIFQLR